MVTNEKNQFIPKRRVIRWWIFMNYTKLNGAKIKEHYLVTFIDKIIDRLAGRQYYCFFDGYPDYNQVIIAPENQEKTTFTCPYGTYAFKRMLFILCNALATFQRYMMAIFHDMVEYFFEVCMDYVLVFL